MSEPYYRYHLFFCVNKREGSPRPCCQNAKNNALSMHNYVKLRIKELGFPPRTVCLNATGCMDLCESGPVLVVYPEGVWYKYANEQDLDEILTSHLQNGQIVERLRLTL
ncbi:MAG: 2Fe-2S ferredoxin [Thiotrichaceae bacterium IS1]|nr:MAG: 2Fe-2S ferredoxin [Thiotrichaceae bacterium IS1]